MTPDDPAEESGTALSTSKSVNLTDPRTLTALLHRAQALGLSRLDAQLLLARAYGLAPASRLTPWSYLQMLLSIPIGWLVFGNLPDAIALLGMLMIAISPNLTLLRQRRVPASAA